MLIIKTYQDIGLNNVVHLNIAHTWENKTYVYALDSNINVTSEHF